jgi:hypothetical protein
VVKQVVSLNEKSNAYHVSLVEGEVRERALPKIVIQA